MSRHVFVCTGTWVGYMGFHEWLHRRSAGMYARRFRNRRHYLQSCPF